MSMLRRSFLRLAGLMAAPAMAARSPEVRAYGCQYRARATVLMLSVPLLHRDNVGSGYFRVAESLEGGKRQLRLEFGAGSIPARAAGLNRLGVFEERIVESGDLLESAQYFGYMTASNEKDLQEARAALHTNGTSSFTAIEGRIEKGRASNLLLKIADVAGGDWAKREELTAEIRARFAVASGAETRTSSVETNESPCSPFLYAVNRAMKDTAGSCTNRFLHNGKIHHLKTTRKRCAEAGVTELEGRIQDEAQKELSSFRLWFEPDQAERGPLRFEFRPRSFLRLTFERV
jgi:hypothetical protein